MELFMESGAMEVEITWGRAAKVWWAFWWRTVLIALPASMILGGCAGGVIGFFLGMLGVPLDVISTVGGVMGFVLGLGVSIVPMKMILGKNFGGFRLSLIQTSTEL
jgi:hypothetical protein